MAQFGPSDVDRRKNRVSTVSADMHFGLDRRVTDIRDRLDIIHRLTASWENEIRNLRSELSSALNYNNRMIQQLLDWAAKLDKEAFKKEIVQGVLMFLNFLSIVASIVVFIVMMKR